MLLALVKRRTAFKNKGKNKLLELKNKTVQKRSICDTDVQTVLGI